MKLNQLLLEFIPSSEIKQRFKNKQIKLNNEPITSLDIDIPTIGHYDELGDFISDNINNLKGINYLTDIKDFFGITDTNIERLKFLTGYNLISISKKEHYVFIIN